MSYEQTYNKMLDMDLFTESMKVSEYLCPLCTGVYFIPVVDSCGHVFCRECISKWFQTTGSVKICPIYKTAYDSNTEDKIIRPLILVQDILEKLEVKCKNKCEWMGKLKDLFKHMDADCRNTTVNCTYEREGCEMKFLRNDREKHEAMCEFKPHPCEHCSESVPLNTISAHEQICPKVKVDCPQTCGSVIERGEVEGHIQDTCENSLVDCIFLKLGCEQKCRRKEQAEHANSSSLYHNTLIVNSLISLHEKFDKISQMAGSPFNEVNQSGILAQFLDNYQKSKIINNGDVTENKKKTGGKTESNTKNSFANKSSKNKKKNNSEDHKSFINNKREREHEKDSYVPMHDRIKQAVEHPNFSQNGVSYTPNSMMFNPDLADSLLENSNMNIDSNFNNFDVNDLGDDEDLVSSDYSSKMFSPLSLDTTYASRGVNITNNRAVNTSQVKNQHKFVFANLVLNDPNDTGDCVWRITVNKKSSWFGFGCCQKERVISNEYKFVASLKEHGCFMLSSNGYSWSTTREDENNVKVTDDLTKFPSIDVSDVIYFKYKRLRNELIISFKDFTWHLHSVTCPHGNYLVPCVVFIHYLDDICFEVLSE